MFILKSRSPRHDIRERRQLIAIAEGDTQRGTLPADLGAASFALRCLVRSATATVGRRCQRACRNYY